MKKYIRSPIVVVLGHVDVGKTTLLDRIRGTAVAAKEPGTMTQHIGASFLPWKALEKMCGPLAKNLRAEIKIPGLLVIDTPGHEAFTNLRRRGGSIADIAILVIDALKGVEKQTIESLEILKDRRTPFIIALNKIDRIPDWESHPGEPFVFSVRKQDEAAVVRLEESIYSVVNELYKFGYMSDRYDRIRDFSKTVAIVPISAKTGEGVPDLLLVLAGLTQRYMLKRLETEERPGRGVVLEVKEEPGLGKVLAVILYDGVIRKGDTIVLGGVEKPIVTRVRALLMPKPLDEMRSPEDRFMQMDEVKAAAGVLIATPKIEGVVAGSPVLVATEQDLDKIVKSVQEEVESLRIQRKGAGVVIKADTLGSLEALVSYVERQGIPVRFADVGPVVHRDVVEAQITKNEDRFLAAILAFNVKVTEEAEVEAKASGIEIFRGNIIYKLVEDLLEWRRRLMEEETKKLFEKVVLPAKIKILPGYVFRRRDPIIVGVEVLEGRIRKGIPLMKEDGRRIGEIMQIQEHNQPISEATKGMAVAISIRSKAIVGRQVKEGEILYSDVPLEDVRMIEERFSELLSDEEKELLRYIKKIKLKSLRAKLG
ncbi:MAG: translation initiation factor IF-2 [Thermoproteales archaeon]|nr:translation initiation factor IF-2 [Thermoproteales archaeon]